MKKNYKWLINIVAICLCICAMAIGIYAAKQASLTATGTIGFTAHNCKVQVDYTVTSYTKTNTTTKTETTGSVIVGGSTAEEITKSQSFGTDLAFTDLANDGNTVVIEMTITNMSDYTIVCNIPNPVAYDTTSTEEITSISGVTSAQSFTLAKDAQKEDLTITFTLLDIETIGDFEANFSANMEFKKYTFDRKVLKTGAMTGLVDETEKAKTKLYVEMGEDENGTALRWYAFAYSATGSEEVGANGMVAVDEFTATDSTSVPAGTYYFISEYVLKNIDSDSIDFDSTGSVNYNNSTVQNYVNGTTGLYTKYNFSADKYSGVYGQITTRTLGGEQYIEFGSNYETIANPTTQSTIDQSLWLLSTSEYRGLFSSVQGKASSLGGSNKSWWLRTTQTAGIESRISVVTESGNLNFSGPKNSYLYCGVRPAFKLVIA